MKRGAAAPYITNNSVDGMSNIKTDDDELVGIGEFGQRRCQGASAAEEDFGLTQPLFSRGCGSSHRTYDIARTQCPERALSYCLDSTMGRKCHRNSRAVIVPMGEISPVPIPLVLSRHFSIAVPLAKCKRHSYALSHHEHTVPPVMPAVHEENEFGEGSSLVEGATQWLEDDDVPHLRTKVFFFSPLQTHEASHTMDRLTL